MFEIKIFNPFVSKNETIKTLSTSSESEARIAAEEYLFYNGIKIGELVPEGSDRGSAIIGFPDQGSSATQNGGFWFVANHTYFVFKNLKEVLGIEVRSFVDLGCGPGNILINARNILGAAKLVGVEIDSLLAEQARKNTAALGAEIIEADLLEWKPAVNDFDMVYAYDPIQELGLRAKFHAGMATWLRDGQYVFYNRIVGEMPVWLEKVEIPNYDVPSLYTFNRDKV